MAICPPFEAVGTATFPSHRFYFADDEDPNKILTRFTVVEGQSVMYYDPFVVEGDEKATRRNLESLTLDEYEKYEKRARTMRFNEIYRETTGRDYLPI